MIGPRVFRSLSWGYHEPGGHVLWWLVRPSMHLHIVGELAFEQMDEAELAVALATQDAALGIGGSLEVSRVDYTVGTPDIVTNVKHKKPGFRGETIGDRLLKVGVPVIPADDDVLNGWKRCLSLFGHDEQAVPWLTIHPRCSVLIEAIPAGLQDVAKQPDDIKGPAPPLLAFRYGAMSRPSPRVQADVVVIPPGSPADIMQKLRLQRMGRRFGVAR